MFIFMFKKIKTDTEIKRPISYSLLRILLYFHVGIVIVTQDVRIYSVKKIKILVTIKVMLSK